MMKKIFVAVAFSTTALFSGTSVSAQDAVVQEGEFGIGVGAAQYFGDLNTRARVNTAKLAASLFFRKNLGNYIALRLGATFAQLGYSDQYNTHNEYMYSRNLSFNSKVWEVTLQGDFNFFRFMPGEPQYSFTPYITFGAGIFSYDPYAYLRGEKVFLRPLGTEGQGSSLYPDRKKYSAMAISIPFGGGINTDYLDDVSKTYVDPAAFPLNPDGSTSNAQLLSDRSFELGEPIGIPGRQRGNSKQKDQFVTAMVHITFNLQSYKCPTAK